MIQLNITEDTRNDIVDAEQLLALLEELVDAINDMDERISNLETP
ncbi:hypothetical protein N9L83_02945 [Flavobacteriales bacterium]|jgi:hypothetical protein|nr:hypothetical protein [Flavobacteriales bacterium]